MDHELKQRLIGAVVVTALAAIFIPMLFDDPVDTSGKTVTELAIPQPPSDSTSETSQNLPENKEQVLARPESELSVSEVEEIEQSPTSGDGQASNSPSPDQASQPIVTDPENQNKQASENMAAKDAEQNEEPELDTGMVQEQDQMDSQNPVIAKPVEPIVNKPKTAAETVAKKPVVSEKPKVKTVSSVDMKKVASKPQQEKSKKSASKLVRYSIQAGSFSKKENAQALVDKLRKQGMPASLVAKGNLYRVKIGPELDKKKAADMRAKLDKQNINSLLTSE